MSDTKEALLAVMLQKLNERIETAEAAIDSAVESRNTATKSSAGDKHETGRALMQTEIDNQKKQLANFIQLKSTLSQIPLVKKTDDVGFGSLIKTSHGFYFLSVSLGKVELSGVAYITLSPAAPLAQAFLGAKSGASILFQGRSFEVFSIE